MNSIFAGWPTGLLIDASTGTAVDKNINDSTIRVRNCTFAGNTVDVKYVVNGTPTGATDASILTWFSNAYHGNTILKTAAPDVLKLIQPFNYTNPDFTPYASSGSFSSSIG